MIGKEAQAAQLLFDAVFPTTYNPEHPSEDFRSGLELDFMLARLLKGFCGISVSS